MSKFLLGLISSGVAALAIAAAHWFPWPAFLHGKRRLTRIEAYSIGTGIITTCTSGALFAAQHHDIDMSPADCARLGMATAAAAGVATIAAWTIDAALGTPQQPITAGDL